MGGTRKPCLAHLYHFRFSESKPIQDWLDQSIMLLELLIELARNVIIFVDNRGYRGLGLEPLDLNALASCVHAMHATRGLPLSDTTTYTRLMEHKTAHNRREDDDAGHSDEETSVLSQVIM